MRKLRSDSFSARLTAGQRDELFAALAGGLAYADAAIKVYEWIRENDAALAADPKSLPGLFPARRRKGRRNGSKLPPRSSIQAWYQATAAEHRYEAAKQVAIVAQAQCPADYDEQTRRALGQAKFLATLEGLRVSDIAALEKNEIAREKLALEREKLERENLLERARDLLERARGGEKGADLQHQIDLALAAIHKMKHGADA